MSMETEYSFTLVKKGYDPDEVAAYIEDLQRKCQRLQSRNSELEQKLDTSRRLIRRFTDMENGLRQNIADSKRAAAAMLSDTKKRSDELLDSARESCGEIISDLDMQIAGRMNTIDTMKAAVASFKDQLFDLYSSHIGLIETISEGAENFTYEPDYTRVAEAVENFEAPGEPEAQMPEFEEYPEESIFDELKDTEPETDTVSVSAAPKAEPEESFAQPADELEEEEPYSEEKTEEIESDSEKDGSDEIPDDSFTLNDTAAEPMKNKEPSPNLDDEYVRFLNDFVNGEES